MTIFASIGFICLLHSIIEYGNIFFTALFEGDASGAVCVHITPDWRDNRTVFLK